MTQWLDGLGASPSSWWSCRGWGSPGGRSLAEGSAAAGEAVSPQVRQAARRLWVLYVALTLAETLALVLTGFSL